MTSLNMLGAALNSRTTPLLIWTPMYAIIHVATEAFIDGVYSRLGMSEQLEIYQGAQRPMLYHILRP
jgi:hypothetical protein